MSTPARRVPAPVELPVTVDHDAWVRYLRERLVEDWRDGEFDLDRWLFTGDPDNPMTTSTRCRVQQCDTVVSSRSMCGECRRAWATSGLAQAVFLSSYRPTLIRERLRGQTCRVGHDGVACQRRRISNQTGLCHAHTTQWNRRGRRSGLALAAWCAQARLLAPRDPCAVTGCAADSKLDGILCGTHLGVWQRDQHGLPERLHESAQRWAAMQTPPKLQAHQFSLAPLAPVARFELLYALQQRDMQGHKLDPVAVKVLVQAATGADSLANVPRRGKVADLVAAKGAAGAYARMLTRIIGLRFEEFRGIVHTDKDVWDCLALDLEAPRAGRRANLARIDFTPISQRWLRDTAKEWVRTMRPDSGRLQRTLLASTLASQALAQRPGGGHDPAVLTFADMTVVFEEIKHAKQSSGQLYNSHFRRGLWAMFHHLIEFGRSTGLLAELPGSFHRSSAQSIRDDEINEDEIGKAIPEPVIAQLDAHLAELGSRHSHGWNWPTTDTAALFQAAYQVLRDTGRRPGELVSLTVDCLEIDQGEWALVYDNYKKRRLRRRLPITTDTAAIIQQWQQHRARIDLPPTGRDWLFPAAPGPFGPGHLSANRFAMVLREWVDAIHTLRSDLPGPDGTRLPFDRTLIYPYAFRHSYAQRHADAGVGVEVLKELMDHRDITVTQGYYKVGLKRKRDAIKIMSKYVHDRTGTLITASGSATGYELKSVAVPFGSCVEPSNVKAGGKQCPIRFQCAGCGFYRPDPSYLPAIEDHINALKADRETAAAMDADTFVIRNLTDQAAAFTDVATAMRDKLAALPDTERTEVEQASATLRKLRASRINLPLTVKTNPDHTNNPDVNRVDGADDARGGS